MDSLWITRFSGFPRQIQEQLLEIVSMKNLTSVDLAIHTFRGGLTAEKLFRNN